MQKHVCTELISSANISRYEIDCYLGGDLINQLVPTTFSARDLGVPYMGVYNACASFGESLITGSLLVEHHLDKVLCITSSHFATAERQY